MPLRTNAKSPGEFIRDHLQEVPGQRDYVGSMYSAYKLHLKDVGLARFPCRQTFHTYIYLLNHTGAVEFDGAEAVGFGGEEPEVLPDGYTPACGMPAPRHFYRMIAFDHPAFLRPKAVWRAQRGLPEPAPAPRPVRPLPAVPRLIAPVVEPEVEVEVEVVPVEAPVPRRRGRPPRVVPEGEEAPPPRRRRPRAPVEEIPGEAPAEAPPPRPRRRARPTAFPAPEVVLGLNARRVDLVRETLVAQGSADLEAFRSLTNRYSQFLSDVDRAYPEPQLFETRDALDLLRNCVSIVERAVSASLRASALGSCQAAARLAGETLRLPLPGEEG